MKDKFLRVLFVLATLLLVVGLVGCGSSNNTNEPAEPATNDGAATNVTDEPAADAPAADVTGKVGIVLPTREEPRWIQDETRFRDALEAAGYEVEILFSQGDSAIELSNVEQLITQGIQVLILTPHDGAAAAAAAEAAHAAGVKVIAYD
ncbi:MAG: substrate-binding domain-containing protein, partial [Anaerolineales bacterium]|nr:substrate-binding domain-containing protein [Anaerolineales bacterium]